MTRGLSANQFKILGTAFHSNRITQRGLPKVKGQLIHDGRGKTSKLVSNYVGPKDINWILAAVVAYGATSNNAFGIEMSPYFGRWLPSLPTRRKDAISGAVESDRLKSIKSSVVHNISNLVRRKLLVLAPDKTGAREGYVLTPQGLEIGKDHEIPFDPILYVACRTLIAPESNFHNQALYFHLAEVTKEDGLDAALAQLAAYNSIGMNQSLDEIRRQREWILAHIDKWQNRWRNKPER